MSMQTFTLTAWVFDRRSLKVAGRKAFGSGALPESGSYDVEGVIRSHQLDAMFRWLDFNHMSE